VLIALSEPVAGINGNEIHIAITAENIAKKYGITRKEADQYSFIGQKRAKTAIETHMFQDELPE